MGLLDNILGAQPGILGNLPPWMQLQGGGDSPLPPWLQNVLGGPQLTPSQGFAPPQQAQSDVLPANAQPASLPSAQVPMGEPRKSIFDPPDSYPGAPPLDRPGVMPQSAQSMPGMNAMAQAGAPQQQAQPQQGVALAGTGGGIKDFLLGTLTGGPLGGISAVMNHGKKQEVYNNLVAQGVPQDKAWFIVNSPQAGQMSGILEPAAKPQWGVIGHDQFGNAQYGFINASTKKVEPYNMPGASNGAGAGDPSVTGEEFLKTLPPGMASQVKAIVEGRQAPPGGFAMRSPMVQQLIQAAAQYEPGFDLTRWTARAAGHKDFYGGGKSSEMVRAANQTIHHVGELVGSMDKLSNTQFPMYNAVGNFVNKEVLGTGAVTEFLPNAHAVAEEMSKVFKGANLSDAEIRQWEASLNQNMSPEQQKAAVGKLMSLLNGSLQALEEKRRTSLGDTLSEQKGPLLDQKSRETLDKVNAWIGGATSDKPAQTAPAQPQAPTATGPNGQKLILQNGQWVPVK